jgi:hypothetical protein
VRPSAFLSGLFQLVEVDGMRIKALRLLAMWVNDYGLVDFDEALYEQVNQFLTRQLATAPDSNTPASLHRKWTMQLMCALIKEKVRGFCVFYRGNISYPQSTSASMQEFARIKYVLSTVPPAPPRPKLDFIQLEAVGMAEALTAVDWEMMSRVTPIALVNSIWPDSASDPKGGQIVQEIAKHFNTVSFWVATEVCTQPEVKNRVAVIEKFIKLARVSVVIGRCMHLSFG